MELRQVVALSATSVVMCFSTPEHSGCKLSRDFSLEAVAHNSTPVGAATAPGEAEQGGQPSAGDADRGAAAAAAALETEGGAQGGQPGGAGAAEADQVGGPSAGDADRGAAAAPEEAERGGRFGGVGPTEEGAQGGQPGGAGAAEAEQGGRPSAGDADRGAAAAPEEADRGGRPGGVGPTEEGGQGGQPGSAGAAEGGQPGNASAGEEGFLPVLHWEPPQRFHGSRASHLEVQRLSEGAFVVCFDHPADPATEVTVDDVDPEQYVVACSLGSVAAAGGLQPFGPPLRLGAGRLVTVVARGNGKSFSVCAREPAAEANASAACAAVRQAPEEPAGDVGGAAATASGDACAASAGEAAEGEAGGGEDAVAAAFLGVACHWGEVQRAGGDAVLRWADEVVQVQGL